MTAKRKFKSPAFEAIPQETMRDFEKEWIASVDKLQPVEITSYSRRPLPK